MQKELSKITVKPFLNTHLKPEDTASSELKFPLYYQVTFKRKNTQVKSNLKLYAASLTQAQRMHSKEIEIETLILKNIVEYEVTKYGFIFELKGLGDKFELYSISVQMLMHQYMSKKLLRALSFTNSEYKEILKLDQVEVKFNTIYKAVKLLIPDFNRYIQDDFKVELEAFKAFLKCETVKKFGLGYLPLIMWLQKGYHAQIFKELVEILEENSKLAEKYMKHLDNMVSERLKYM